MFHEISFVFSWSFGVLLFEMFSCGGIPYATVPNQDLGRFLSDGYRLEAPEHCPEEVYDIMKQCWCKNPNDRPNMEQMQNELYALLDLKSHAPVSIYCLQLFI